MYLTELKFQIFFQTPKPQNPKTPNFIDLREIIDKMIIGEEEDFSRNEDCADDSKIDLPYRPH